ncbi:MAG TPA: TonB-dependent receptor [Candidatus Acidoferrum sp.]|nr:TonB-dependent receptor [Candidatus Acidoferrum sp.]
MQRLRSLSLFFLLAVLAFAVGFAAVSTPSVFAQETTAGLQGTVKDPSGAVVPHAKVVVTAASLVGTKETETDGNGYYRFANLPPASYIITVTAKGFATIKRELVLEVGHLPTVDFAVEVGASATVVEVSAASPLIDVTTNVTTTNVTEDVIDNIPHGRSFQSVIQFAPAARNEPLMGNTTISNGSGSIAPGNGSNGGDHGFSVAGGADSENSYLVEGQETANLAGGFSHTTVPFDFIQEVEIKNSGIQAEHGGALGGVVNVIQKKGTNKYHGSVFAQFENDAMDANQPTTSRLDPATGQQAAGPGGSAACLAANTCWGVIDPVFQEYTPKKDKFSDVFPGFTFGGPIWKNRIFGFVGFNPEFTQTERGVNYGASNSAFPTLGLVNFSQNTQTYYTTARVDTVVTQKLRVYGSWLYQLQKQHGTNLPFADSSQGQDNLSATINPSTYGHFIGYTAPNVTTNVGADYSITPRLILTGRFGYYFENYHDFGLPTNGIIDQWETNGTTATDAFGNPLPASLQQAQFFVNAANSATFTTRNANKAIQVDANLAWYKSGWLGTHNFKFGYQLNRLSNLLGQHYNEPYVQFWVGKNAVYSPQGSVGQANCAAVEAADGTSNCQGKFGYVSVYDFGDGGAVTSYNHSLFVQDSWSIAKGLTINAGLRVEKEFLPAENQPAGGIAHPIDFSWGDKIAPRIGIAWDPTGKGKIKIFGGYGQFYDQMKLNLAISSFGGQYWNQCFYALDTSNVASITPAFDANQRFCPGTNGSTGSATQANFPGGTPAGLTFLENQNFRANPTTCSTCSVTEEGVAPGLKPYKQHESTIGVDYQLAPSLAFEARYDRRRLDHVIEDSAIFNPAVGETFVIVNPGQGINSTYDKFFNFLYGVNNSNCGSACPPTIPAQRDYDGLELRLTKSISRHWAGLFSYTYSRLWGNYSGLTSSYQGDGGGGRNAPNNSRAFDEPFFSWDANGHSASGLLPTDRPNVFKGYVYYELNWLHKFTTDFGIFQAVNQGSPETSYLDVGFAFPGGFPTYVYGSDKWVDVHQDPTTGLITTSNPRLQRTPWFNQTDFNMTHSFKIGESKTVSFSGTLTNLLNQRAVTAVGEQIDSNTAQNFIAPGGNTNTLFNGTGFYSAAFHPYDVLGSINSAASSVNCPSTSNPNGVCGPLTVNSQYGQPNRYQIGRTIRIGLKFTF